jgi:LacI family transcriptional regulator
MITIKDIAKEAQVSEGTIDRVLHNRGGVSKKTEERVRLIFKKYNFKVNPVASALATKTKFKIATLIPNFDNDNLFWESPLLGIIKASEEVKTFGVEVDRYTFDQFDSDSYLNQFNSLLKSKPSAVLLVPTFIQETKVIVNKLETKNIPYMFLNIDLDGFNNISFIGQNSYMAGYIAGKLIHSSLPNQSTALSIQTRLNINNYYAISKRIEGFNSYFIKNDINVKTVNLKFDNLQDLNLVKVKLNSFLNENKSIKGVFVPSSRISIIANCIDNNLINNLNVIGFDNIKTNIDCLEADRISYLISQKPFEQGYESIQVLTDFLLHKKEPVKKIYSPIDILIKENVMYNERK